MQFARGLVAAAMLVGVLALAGCGGPATGDVAGTASYENVAIEEGRIDFIPADGKGSTAGGLIKEGKYSVPNVSVGTMKVVVSSSKIVGKKKMYDTPNSPVYDLKGEALPEKYSDMLKTELRFDVQSGKNEKNWELKK